MAVVWLGGPARGALGIGDLGVSYVVSRVPRRLRIARGLVWSIRRESISGQADSGYAGSFRAAIAECDRLDRITS